MKSEKTAAKLKLSESDLASIRQAVQDAERLTNGEIALAAAPESSDYSFFELFASVVLGAVCFALLLPLHGSVVSLVDRLFWHVPSWYVPAFYGAATFAVIALFFLFANIPAVDRIVVPRAARRKAVYERAIRHFVESGVYGTADRTGILVFISLLEREVRIVADSGINAKIEQAEWDRIASLVATGVKTGKTAEALIAAVTECGKLLAEYFPAKKENPNELADGLVLLEAGA